MKKAIIYAIVGLIFLLGALYVYWLRASAARSPADKAEYTKGDFSLGIRYCRPFKRGRLIFGEESEAVLVPFGKYWRTGANDATEIEINKDVLFNNSTLKKGKYRMYTISGKSEWVIALNSELGKSGHKEPDYARDVLRVTVPSALSEKFYDQFTISVKDISDSTWILLNWDTTEIRIPIRLV
ncbi:MAG TPA: DUF2911 domain-containing protein [Cyclobacteriaceae bacterium]|nr:DUF2911 domain-containing protein [Cyclobacteriaceae bacterium]